MTKAGEDKGVKESIGTWRGKQVRSISECRLPSIPAIYQHCDLKKQALRLDVRLGSNSSTVSQKAKFNSPLKFFLVLGVPLTLYKTSAS